jgi:hypothetical protein
VIRLGLRLTVAGGREAAIRLVVTAAAVALGVGLLLTALAGMNALQTQNARTAWLNTGAFPGVETTTGSAPDQGVGPPAVAGTALAPLWWKFSIDYVGNQMIDRIDVAATGADSPVPPGITRVPGPGQFYASPALAHLLQITPVSELGDRYPGRQVGIIGAAALPSPNSLIVVIGRTGAQLSTLPGASQVSAINTTTGHSGGSNGWDASKLQVILAVGALALLFPVLIFIGTATRLSAARREQRLAAIRLVGGTADQVATLATVEASVAAISGMLAGFVLFFALRPVLIDVPFTGAPFAAADLSLGIGDIALVAVGVPTAAAIAARLALRRVQLSPLGVTRRVTPLPPRIYRLAPLIAGIAELAYFVEAGAPKSTGGQIMAYFSGCLLVMAGLLIAGPSLTMVSSQLIARRTHRPAALLAARRLADNPQAAFRAVSGLIVAIFITSLSIGVITTIVDDHGTGDGTGATTTLIDQFSGAHAPPGQTVAVVEVPAILLRQLRTIAGVEGVTVLYGRKYGQITGRANAATPIVAACDQLAHTPALGRCTPGAGVVTTTVNLASPPVTGHATLAASTWSPISAPSLLNLARLPIQALVVETTGSPAALEQARTTLEAGLPDSAQVTTLSEINATNIRTITELQQLTKVVIVISLVVAGCSLAVSVTTGVTDRKRPFSLLRLTGVPVAALRRVVALEAAVPLLVTAVLATSMGFLTAALFLKSQLAETLQPPATDYYILVGSGLLASLAVIASTLPLIERMTGPDTARSE